MRHVTLRGSLCVGAIAAIALGVGVPAALAAPHAAARKPANWSTYHFNAARSGNYPSMPRVTGALKVVKRLKLDGAVYGSPVVIGGDVVVATENNTVYRFSPTYKLRWKRHIGAPSPAAQRPCGNIDPLGITGAPVYSAKTGYVYVAAELSGSPPRHRLYAVSFNTGRVVRNRNLDLPGVARAAMQERGALTIVGSRVYVPFGGLAGDCGQYKGRVVSYDVTGKGRPTSYTVPTAREAGIWTPPGPVADRDGHIYVSVGNGASGVGDRYDHSDSVLQLSKGLKLTGSFSPTTWPTDNDSDLDLGSQAPALLGKWVFSAGKSGTAYVLRRGRLGGIGGQVSQTSLCVSFGGTATRPGRIYVPCTDGIRAIRIDHAGRVHVVWHAASGTSGSPVLGGGRFWSLDVGAGVLHSLGLNTGRSRAAVAVGAVSRFATPALYGRDVYVPTLAGLTVVRTS